jgi:hypothetical protein
MDSVLDIIEIICKRSSPKITKAWLLDNVAFQVLLKFIEYTFEQIGKTDEKEGTSEGGKN